MIGNLSEWQVVLREGTVWSNVCWVCHCCYKLCRYKLCCHKLIIFNLEHSGSLFVYGVSLSEYLKQRVARIELMKDAQWLIGWLNKQSTIELLDEGTVDGQAQNEGLSERKNNKGRLYSTLKCGAASKRFYDSSKYL